MDDRDRYWRYTEYGFTIHWEDRKVTNRITEHLIYKHGIGEIVYKKDN